MNKKDLLVESTIKALQGKLIEGKNKLNEDESTNSFYKEFTNKVKQIIDNLTKDTDNNYKRTENILIVKIRQDHLINRKDYRDYILNKLKLPDNLKDFAGDYRNSIYNEMKVQSDIYKEAEDFFNNQYIPALENYMDLHKDECKQKILETFENNDIKIKDLQVKLFEKIDSITDFKEQYIDEVINFMVYSNKKLYFLNPNDYLYLYRYEYTITIDMNDNKTKKLSEDINIPDITHILEKYDWEVDITTEEQLGSEYFYYKLCATTEDAMKFNYHSDYWGDADSYQEDNIDLMERIEPYVGKEVIVSFDDGDVKFKILGIVIDKQYNDLSHTKILAENLGEVE